MTDAPREIWASPKHMDEWDRSIDCSAQKVFQHDVHYVRADATPLSQAIATPEVKALVEAMTALCDAYAACNGEDHPAYVAARAALRAIGEAGK